MASGSDGGPICFLLDWRASPNPGVAGVSFRDLAPLEVRSIAPAFGAAIQLAIGSALIGDNL